MLSEAPGPLRYKFYAPVQFFTHFLVMILNAENNKINLWANLPDYAKKTRSGTAPVQHYDNHQYDDNEDYDNESFPVTPHGCNHSCIDDDKAQDDD